MRARMAIPDAIAGAPRLWPGMEPYWEAFSELTTERYPGFSLPGRIPVTRITQWCRDRGLPPDEEDAVKHHVAAMDVAYLEHQAKKLEDK